MTTEPRHEALRIAGERVGAERAGDRRIEVLNPYTDAVIGSVPKATLDEVREAMASMRDNWSRARD